MQIIPIYCPKMPKVLSPKQSNGHCKPFQENRPPNWETTLSWLINPLFCPLLPFRSKNESSVLFFWLSVLPWKLRCLSPLAFVGSSQSHMISMRCRTFNATAGGYMRGDGCSGLKLVFTWKPSSSNPNPGESTIYTCNESPTFRIHPDQISVHCTRTTTISCD